MWFCAEIPKQLSWTEAVFKIGIAKNKIIKGGIKRHGGGG